MTAVRGFHDNQHPFPGVPRVGCRERLPYLTIGGINIVRRAMSERSLTVTALARHVGLSRKHLSQILNRRVPVTDAVMETLMTTLDLQWHGRSTLAGPLHPNKGGPQALPGLLRIHGDLTEPMDWEWSDDPETWKPLGG